MKKNTKILLGVGALAVVGYFVYKNNKPKANASGRCSGRGQKEIILKDDSGTYSVCQTGTSVPTVTKI